MSKDLDTMGLDQLIKALKAKMVTAKVGILGAKAIRNDTPVDKGRAVNATKGKAPKGKFNASTNAALGAIHEFGGPTMPQRSFLRVPIADNLQKEMEASGAFDPDALREVVKEGSLTPWVQRIAILAESIVGKAFATGGFGKWPAWKNPQYTNRDNRLLVDSGQLRDSITSEVKK